MVDNYCNYIYLVFNYTDNKKLGMLNLNISMIYLILFNA